MPFINLSCLLLKYQEPFGDTQIIYDFNMAFKNDVIFDFKKLYSFYKAVKSYADFKGNT